MTPPDESNDARTFTGSRGLDLAVLAGVALAMVVGSTRLTVYYSATVIDVTLTRTDPDGTTQSLPTPAPFHRLGGGYWKIEEVEPHFAMAVQRYMQHSDLASQAPDGARFIWTARYALDSLELDRELRVVWEATDER